MKLIDFIKEKGLLDEFKKLQRAERTKRYLTRRKNNLEKSNENNKRRVAKNLEKNREKARRYYYKNKLLTNKLNHE